MDWTAEDLTEFFDFLDDLRESGVTNMYGAGAYLEDEFDMSRKDASEVLSAWMKTFSRDEPPEARAEKALAA